MTTGMLLSGQQPREMAARWSDLDVRDFSSPLPLRDYLRGPWALPAAGRRGRVAAARSSRTSASTARRSVTSSVEGTFNVVDFVTKTCVAVPHTDVDAELLAAGMSLPLVMPPLRRDGRVWTDAVWVKDANVTEALRRGADEVWLVWCIGNSPYWGDGPLEQYVHMIEMSANGALFAELDAARRGRPDVPAARRAATAPAAAGHRALRRADQYRRPWSTSGYRDAWEYLDGMAPDGVPHDATCTAMTEPPRGRPADRAAARPARDEDLTLSVTAELALEKRPTGPTRVVGHVDHARGVAGCRSPTAGSRSTVPSAGLPRPGPGRGPVGRAGGPARARRTTRAWTPGPTSHDRAAFRATAAETDAASRAARRRPGAGLGRTGRRARRRSTAPARWPGWAAPGCAGSSRRTAAEGGGPDGRETAQEEAPPVHTSHPSRWASRCWRPGSTWPSPRAWGRTNGPPPTACGGCCARRRTPRTASTRQGRVGSDAGGAGPGRGLGYQNLHAARAQMVDVYDDEEIAAEIPAALARSQQTLHRDDPRRLAGRGVDADGARPAAGLPAARHRGRVRRDGPPARAAAQLPQHHPAAGAVHRRPRQRHDRSWCAPTRRSSRCASRPTARRPRGRGSTARPGTSVLTNHGSDILVVALLGLLGGALAAAVSIRNLRGTSTPYDVPVALALLKVPLGAFTAIVGLVAIQGKLRPRPVGAGLAAADPGVRPGARLRPAGVHLLAGPQGAVAARRPALEGPDRHSDACRREAGRRPCRTSGPVRATGWSDVPVQGPPPAAEDDRPP